MLKRDIRIILPDIRSTYNVGSVFRSAECFGVSHIYFCGYTPYPKTNNDSRLPHEIAKLEKQIQKTALGAEKIINYSYEENIIELIKNLKKSGYQVVSVEQSQNSTKLSKFSYKGNITVIFGNEIKGIAKNILDISDEIVEIPLLGNKESLNVSSTAAIVLYILKYSSYD